MDVVDVGNDRSAGFSGAPTARLAPKSSLILVASSHSNSNQSYLSTQMIFIREDRLQLINSVFAFSDKACAFDRKHVATLTPAPSPGPYRALQVEVLETVTATGADCGSDKPPPAGKKAGRAVYRWDAKVRRFVTKSKQLDELFKLDMKRF